jgi:peptidoglycan/LPS O-acetylase OafA/YrhL
MKLSYRPEIDGLRAIAIISVIIYHLELKIFGYQFFKGGFIGVDLFLVISGYLISLIIFEELITKRTFSFLYFYERRVRRILPVLLLVMLVSLLFAYMYLLPSDLIDFSKSILYSLGFISNFYFHYSGQQYFQNEKLIPHLHTWSLSVEWQFYILFPIILLILFKYFRKYLVQILILAFIMSLGLAEWGSRNHSSFNFYILPTRAWEVLAGSILAYFELNKIKELAGGGGCKFTRVFNLTLPKLGMLLIIFSIFFFNDNIPHPSIYTLLPVIGIILVIRFSQYDEFITKILRCKLFVGIGLISYSLYVWHYPILTFSRIDELTHDNAFKKIIISIIILIISFFSYYLIEKPFRNKKIKISFIFKILSLLFLLLILFNLAVIFKDGLKKRNSLTSNLNLIKTWKLLEDENNKNCFEKKNFCTFGKNFTKKVYLVGDSTIGSLAFNLNELLKIKNYQLITSYWSKCLLFPGFDQYDKKTKKLYNDCSNDYFNKIFNILKNEENSIIIIGGRFPSHINIEKNSILEGGFNDGSDNYYVKIDKSKKDIKDSFLNSIEKIKKNNNVILIYPIPESHKHFNQKLINKIITDNPETYIKSSYEAYKIKTRETYNLFNLITAKNLHKVKPDHIFCNTLVQKKCIMNNESDLFYIDYVHLSYEGSKLVNNLIMKEIEKIESKSK